METELGLFLDVPNENWVLAFVMNKKKRIFFTWEKMSQQQGKRLKSFNGGGWITLLPLHKKWSFLLEISRLNMTKSSVSCGFGHIYRRNP